MARQRLSSKFITFNSVKGKMIYEDFFYEGELQNEEGIESAYNNGHSKATNNKVRVLKYKAPKRGKTDGYVKAFITEKDGNEYVNFCGIQEVKLNIKRDSAAYRQQIAQSLLYAGQYKIGEIKFVLLPSVNYIDYFFIDENEINWKELLDLLEDYPPSKACTKVKLPNLKIYRMDMPTEADITNMWKEIYRHCINI